MKQISIEHRFKDYVAREKLFRQTDRLLLAVSGGVDSAVLCHLCHACSYTFQIAHCNFNLRGEESNGDADFVRGLALTYKVPYHQKEFETASYAELNNVSIQVAARELRYNWFRELVDSEDSGLAYLLTAHHADDNVETILMNFFKGTGITGLKGIMPKQGKIIRPLLFAHKNDLLQYASVEGLNYREDSSNASEKYARNFFRNSIIPSIEDVFPAVVENIAANAERFRDIKLIYEEAVNRQLSKLIVMKGEEVHLPVLKLQQLPALKTFIYEIVKNYGFSSLQTTDVLNLLDSETGKFVCSSTHRIYRYNKWLIIASLKSEEASSILIQESDESVVTKDFVLKFNVATVTNAIETSKEIAMLDKDLITYPLILRKWKTGDYFYPLGMPKKKKLGRFLSDQKLTLTQKENTWLLESHKRIIWVLGYRIDDRFKVTGKTKRLLKINRRPSE